VSNLPLICVGIFLRRRLEGLCYSHQYTPNSSAHDVLVGWDVYWCGPFLSQPELNLPCVPGANPPATNTAAARSRHPGGVHVLLADGSARFVGDSVEILVWQAMASIQGGEVYDLP